MPARPSRGLNPAGQSRGHGCAAGVQPNGGPDQGRDRRGDPGAYGHAAGFKSDPSEVSASRMAFVWVAWICWRFGTCGWACRALADQTALVLGRPRETHQWLLTDESRQTALVPCNVRFASDDMSTLKNAAEMSLGLVALPSYVCRSEIEARTLVRVLPNWTAGRPQISLLIPTRRGMLPAVEAFLDCLKQDLPAVLALWRYCIESSIITL